ncbi:MAG: zinc ribbon domain-containing protein [Ardenticatenaceae bacterium]|nr:zinc ribbon domain-containing protein [Ardenticatenaceae bacterium]
MDTTTFTLPVTLPEPTHSCSHCHEVIEPGQSSCPWCGSLLPYLVQPSNLPDWFEAEQVAVQAVRESGLPLTETTFLALGGGLGSFAWVDYLRVCGVAAEQIRVVGQEAKPYARFARLCEHSQIFGEERIRSDSGSRPDNLWGWPGYAVQEVAELLRARRWAEAGRIFWQILTEPTFTETYAPPVAMVYRTMEREMARIGWEAMLRRGEICGVRQTDDGRYLIAIIPQGQDVPQFVIASFVHLALGHPGIHLTPETQAYRQEFRDVRLVVQAYEAHEHVYEQLARRGGILLLRGRGIVASRILQRVDEIRRETGRVIQVVHLLRSPLMEDVVYGQARRPTRHHWQRQPFNFPKAAFGGDLRVVLEEAAPEERQDLLATWGGVTTSNRQDWLEIVERGGREGWYRLVFGNVVGLRMNGRRRLIAQFQDYDTNRQDRFVGDFLIDCTGLNSGLALHPILADLQARYGLARNLTGQLAVSSDFELVGMRHDWGQVYMAGTIAFGNAFAPVDSFMGLQYAAQRSVDALIRARAPGVRYLNGLNSLRQWGRWWRGAAP